jgi:pheromone shutdown protein TraB
MAAATAPEYREEDDFILLPTLVHRKASGRSNHIAFVLCAIEAIGIICAAVFGGFVGQDHLLKHFSAWLWLACGLGSIGFSIASLAAGSNRRASIWTLILCLIIFVLCGFAFAIV